MLLKVNSSKLEKKRKAKKLSQHKLSILSGLSGNAVYRMEREKHNVSYLRAKAISNVLECSIEEIFEPINR